MAMGTVIPSTEQKTEFAGGDLNPVEVQRIKIACLVFGLLDLLLIAVLALMCRRCQKQKRERHRRRSTAHVKFGEIGTISCDKMILPPALTSEQEKIMVEDLC